jgi:hypothetical protein
LVLFGDLQGTRLLQGSVPMGVIAFLKTGSDFKSWSILPSRLSNQERSPSREIQLHGKNAAVALALVS